MRRGPGSYYPTVLIAAALLCSSCLETHSPQPELNEPASGQPAMLALLAPNGGEVWTAGETCPVTWETRGTPGRTVRIELLHDGELCTTIASAAENDGCYEWECIACGPGASGYQIQITDIERDLSDCSDRTFTLSDRTDACVLTITEPVGSLSAGGNAVWREGETLRILWNADGAGCGDEVCIELHRNHQPCQVIAASAPNSGEYDWVVARCSPDSTYYGFRVTDRMSGASGQTCACFTIRDSLPVPALRVICPNGGEEWIEGQSYTLLWESSGPCGDVVRIQLLQYGTPCEIIADSTANDGAFTWIAQLGDREPGAMTVRITDLLTGVSDESDAPFTILRAETIVLLTPNGGEEWVVGGGL